MTDEEPIDMLPKPDTTIPPLPPQKFRGLKHELERLLLIINGQIVKSLKEQVQAAHAFVWLAIEFLSEFPEEEERCKEIARRIRTYPWPRIDRDVITGQEVTVSRLTPRGFRSGETSHHDVLPGSEQVAIKGILDDMFGDHLANNLQPIVQLLSHRLMLHGILRSESRVAQGVSQYFESIEDDSTSETEDDDMIVDDTTTEEDDNNV